VRQFLWLALLSTHTRYGGPSLWRTFAMATLRYGGPESPRVDTSFAREMWACSGGSWQLGKAV